MNAKLGKSLLALGLVASLGALAQEVSSNPHWGDDEFRKVRAGLTQEEVRSLIGKPNTVQGDLGASEIKWIYRFTDLTGYDAEFDVTFDESGHVTKVDSGPPGA